MLVLLTTTAKTRLRVWRVRLASTQLAVKVRQVYAFAVVLVPLTMMVIREQHA
jgi:hypothetical protein